MKFSIKPSDTSFDVLLEAGQYQQIWSEHEQSIIEAFRKLTGLEFQQDVITANVIIGDHGDAGGAGRDMTLPGDYTTNKYKTCTLVHELAHRLLGGNALGPVALGLIPDTDQPDPRYANFEHRHIYLFLQDVIIEIFGAEYARICSKSEQDTASQDYLEAWSWAMGMSFEQRQQAVRQLAKEALPRDRWHERDDVEIPQRDPEAWFGALYNR